MAQVIACKCTAKLQLIVVNQGTNDYPHTQLLTTYLSLMGRGLAQLVFPKFPAKANLCANTSNLTDSRIVTTEKST
jgi:hypothetical protein